MLGGDVIAKIVHSRRKRVSGTVTRRQPHPACPSLFPFPLPHMSIQSDRWITRMAKDHGMIEPFENSQVRAGVISYGVSSYGYDMRVAPEFKIFTNVMSSIVDPKRTWLVA